MGVQPRRLGAATGPDSRSRRCNQQPTHLEMYRGRKHRLVADGWCWDGFSGLGLRQGRALHTRQAAPPRRSPLPLLPPRSSPSAGCFDLGYIIGKVDANQILLYSFSSFSRQSEQ